MSGGLEGIGRDDGRGHIVATASGLPFWPMDPRVEDIRLSDIAHGLSMLVRFNGAVHTFYSVAQHSVIMSRALDYDRDLAREALLHDGAETYVGDLIRPVKAHCPDWCAIDARIDAVIRIRFGLPETMSEAVRQADMRMFATERRDLLTVHQSVDWGALPEPYDAPIIPVGWAKAKALFLDRAAELGVS